MSICVNNTQSILEVCDNPREIQLNAASSDSSTRLTSNSNFPLIFEVKRQEKRRISIHRIKSYSSRVVKKNGKLNVFLQNIPNKKVRFIKDLGNTLLHTRWRWILLSLLLSNVVAYMFFAIMWMFINRVNTEGSMTRSGREPCVVGTNSFTGYLLLSIETLTTIGFGEIYPTDCQENWIILTFQALVGVAIEGALVTAIYVKMARPVKNDHVSVFSKKALICLRDENLCLVLRVRDTIGKYLAKTSIKLYFCQPHVFTEGEYISNYFIPLKIEPFGTLIWPLDIVHKITSESPLWNLSAKDMLMSRFEIMVLLEGDSISTGQPSQSRTSYISSEILWGHRFVPCVDYNNEKEHYIVNSKKFNALSVCDIPLCSAKKLKEILDEIKLRSQVNSSCPIIM